MSFEKTICNARASTINIVNSVFIVKNPNSRDYETLKTPNKWGCWTSIRP